MKHSRASIAPVMEPSRGGFAKIARLLHQMSQPLTSLRGTLELALLEDLKKSEFHKVLEQSIEEADRLSAGLAALRELVEADGSARILQELLNKPAEQPRH